MEYTTWDHLPVRFHLHEQEYHKTRQKKVKNSIITWNRKFFFFNVPLAKWTLPDFPLVFVHLFILVNPIVQRSIFNIPDYFALIYNFAWNSACYFSNFGNSILVLQYIPSDVWLSGY